MADTPAPAPDAPAGDGYQRVLAAADVAPGSFKRAEAGGYKMLICRVGETYYAIENKCSHAELPLQTGKIRGDCIVCPVHGARFQLSDGKHLSPPAWKGIRTFALRVVDGHIEVNPEPRNAPGSDGGVRSIAF